MQLGKVYKGMHSIANLSKPQSAYIILTEKALGREVACHKKTKSVPAMQQEREIAKFSAGLPLKMPRSH